MEAWAETFPNFQQLWKEYFLSGLQRVEFTPAGLYKRKCPLCIEFDRELLLSLQRSHLAVWNFPVFFTSGNKLFPSTLGIYSETAPYPSKERSPSSFPLKKSVPLRGSWSCWCLEPGLCCQPGRAALVRDRERGCGRPPATPQLAESHPRCSCFTPAELLRNAYAGCNLLLLLPFLPPSQELGQQPAGFQLRTLGSEPPVVPVPLLAAKCAPVASPVTRCHPWKLPLAGGCSRDRQGSAELPLQLGQGGAPRRKGCCCNKHLQAAAYFQEQNLCWSHPRLWEQSWSLLQHHPSTLCPAKPCARWGAVTPERWDGVTPLRGGTGTLSA